MYKLCKTEESNRRQREIEGVLLSLMGNKKYDEITVSEICEHAKIPRKAFYRYFDNKDGALRALLYHTITDFHIFSLGLGKKERRTLGGEFEEFFLFWREKSHFLDVLSKSNLLGFLVEMTTAYTIGELSAGEVINFKKFFHDDTERDPEIVFRFVICGLMAITIGWYQGGFAESVSEMSKTAARFMSKPLFPNLDEYGIETK